MLDLGNSVAEFDESLAEYFVETDTFRALVSDKADIIAGDKGTGKTALFKILHKRYAEFPELSHVQIVPAFNMIGNPVFQHLARENPLKEAQYSSVWKTYVLSLVGNWLLQQCDPADDHRVAALDALLRRLGLRTPDDSAETVFRKVVGGLKRLLRPKSAEVAIAFSEAGVPVITPKIEFGEGDKPPAPEMVLHEDALRVLNDALTAMDVTVWVVFDRLDEAFQGFPDTEVPALRALLRTYLDLLAFDRVRLKLFVRKDLFRKVTEGGFVNLTHVNARKTEIVWEEEDLLSLLCRRVRGNADLMAALELQAAADSEVFYSLFARQVDVGQRKPTTWAWMMSRIRDGNNVKPPRNLIDLVASARQAQLRSDNRNSRAFVVGRALIEADAIRKALTALSENRVQDTLIAESPALAPLIERFKDGKAEHNVASLAALLEVEMGEVRNAIKALVEAGFLEEVGDSFKVPMLYRDGLSVTQGKAFAAAGGDDEGEEGTEQ